MSVRNFLENRLGKEVEICCEGITVSGKAAKVEGNVLLLEKDGVTAYVNIEKIIIVWDSQEKKAHSPGFISQSNNGFGAGVSALGVRSHVRRPPAHLFPGAALLRTGAKMRL